MQVIKYPPKAAWPEILKRPTFDISALESTVGAILKEVKESGDKAIRKFTLQFDKVAVDKLQVSEKEIAEAGQLLTIDLKKAIQQAKANIEKFHSAQREPVSKIDTMPGVSCWRKSVAIERVGLYIPGGTAPLFSTVLMLGIPAKLAGCSEIILCSPPSADGKLNPAILYAASLAGITKIFKAGGVQAIGALAYGTETIPKTDKIFGPGNQFVTCAKQLIARQGTAIDMPAGPSEVAVFADDSSVPAFVAADLLSQAEHGKDSQVILITTNEVVIDKVQEELQIQLNKLPRKAIIEQALVNSKLILLKKEEDAIDLLNEYAPEHLILSCKNDEAIGEKIINAGSVFLGNYSPESVGDYASGTNHTLPTNGFARTYSGVSLDSFIKKITFQKLSSRGLQNIAPIVEEMAAAEGLEAHKRAVSIRKNTGNV